MLTLTSQTDALGRHTKFSSRIECSLAYSSGASTEGKGMWIFLLMAVLISFKPQRGHYVI